MRLRSCQRPQEHTRLAAQLADNACQAELARRQAITIRTMKRGHGTRRLSQVRRYSFAQSPCLWSRHGPSDINGAGRS